jgi:type IV pilus assembly protein PilM
LNVGAANATLAIRGSDGWPFIRDLNLGGDQIIRQMADMNDTSPKEIREILFNAADAGELKLQDSLKKTCQKLTSDVTGTLRFHAAQAKSAEVDKLLVCGGFALAQGFIDLLNSRLGTQAVLWNPFDNMHVKTGGHCEEICGKAGPVMAVAAGLAMRTL